MLLNALEDGVPEVRQEAVIALVNLYTETGRQLFPDPGGQASLRAAEPLQRAGSPATTPSSSPT